MRQRTFNQTCLAAARIIAIVVCLCAPSAAEAPNPTPTPSPAPTTPSKVSFSQALTDMASRASDLLPIVQSELEGPLLPWLEELSLFLGSLVAIAAFARLWRENGGAGADLFWWFARLGVIFAIVGSGPKIIDGMFLVGREIAVGVDGSSPLFQLYVKQRGNFDIAYRTFQEGMFTVKGVPYVPTPGGVMGVVLSAETSIPDPVRKLDSVSRDMTLLFDSLNFSRGVLTFGDFFLTMLGSFLMIAMRLAAPVMIALAIDRNLAQRVTYPYVWGVVVLTLIWPIVVLIIKAIAYMGGNVAMAMGDKQQFFQFDDKSMQIINSSQSHPFYTASFAAVIMLIAGLTLWAAPYIAYQLSVGRVYEGVSTTISSWVGQLMGIGIGYYSTTAAAGLNRQAEVLQANAQLDAAAIQAKAGQDAGERYARASKILGVTQANASARYQNSMAFLASKYQIDVANGQLELMTGLHPEKGPLTQQLEILEMLALRDGSFKLGGLAGLDVHQRSNELIVSAIQEAERIDAGVTSAFVTNSFRALSGAAGYNSQNNAITSAGDFGAAVVGAHLQLGALSDATGRRTGFLEDYKRGLAGNYVLNNARQKIAADDNRIGSENASKALARDVTGGYYNAYSLVLDGNRIIKEGSIKAAEKVQTASLDAARMRYNAAIISDLGRTAAKDIEQALTLRY
jgi:hypothetical protein